MAVTQCTGIDLPGDSTTDSENDSDDDKPLTEIAAGLVSRVDKENSKNAATKRPVTSPADKKNGKKKSANRKPSKAKKAAEKPAEEKPAEKKPEGKQVAGMVPTLYAHVHVHVHAHVHATHGYRGM